MGRIAGRFGRVETRRRASRLVAGLLAGLPRANCWTIAEHVGDDSPDGMQYLLARAVWDERAVCDDLREYVVEHLGPADAVLVMDETGDLKKGVCTVGVQRQYTGTAGRIENAQVAVYLVYASGKGHAFIDRALYLPASWTGDPARMAAAGIPEDVRFATKPQLAGRMIAAALDAGVQCAWVTGDEVYGADPRLRAELEARGVGYVLAVARDHRVSTGIGPRRAADLAVRLPERAWRVRSAGAGAKGQRLYQWAQIDIHPPAGTASTPDGHHWLLIRRHVRTGELAFYHCYAPATVPLAQLIRVAGRRWSVEESFQTGKELTALDQHQVRRWTSWHRWTVLAMLAHAFLAVTAAHEHHHPAPDNLIALTCNEIRHLYIKTLTKPATDPAHLLHWSTWRRHHQQRARHSHYQRQATHST